MKRNLLVLAVLTAFGFAPAAISQDVKAAPATTENAPVTGDNDPVAITGDITQQINDFITAHQDALNKTNSRHFEGVAAIGVPAGKKGYAASRVIAYKKAFLMARQAFGAWLQVQVKSALSTALSENGLGEAETPVQKSIRDTLMKSLMEQAKSQGIDVNDKAAFDQFVKDNVVNTTKFQQQVAAAGNVFQQGLMAYKTFATDTHVGVVAVYNDRNLAAAKALRTGSDNTLRGNAKTTLRSQIPTAPKILACTFGARVLRNEKGEYCVIGYGHGVAKSKSAQSKVAAIQKAALQATAEIKEFAGEQIVFSKAQETAEAGGELRNGTITAENSESFESKVKQEESTLILNGVRPLMSTTIQLPSGEIIVVTASAWVPGDAMHAKKTAQKMLVGKDEKNQGFSSQDAEENKGIAAQKTSQKSSSAVPTDLKAKPTTGTSDEADLD